MKYVFIILLIITIIIVACTIVYIMSYSKITEINQKIEKAQKNIENLLAKKYSLMNECYKLIKKSVKKKDYLKDFDDLKIENMNSYDADTELNRLFETIDSIKGNYKVLKTKEYKDLINEVYEVSENIIASEKYFNKYNNILIKQMNGINKIIAKISNIKVRTSYEIKEPTED